MTRSKSLRPLRVLLALAVSLVLGCGGSTSDDVGESAPDGSAGAAGAAGGQGGGGADGGAGGADGSADGSAGAAGSGGSADAGPKCDASTCAGCCGPNGECLDGDAINACGTGGGACQACDALGFACISGKCDGTAPPCGPATCTGCCDANGLCRAGTQTDACGAAGSACANCAAQNEGCSGGACQGAPPVCGPASCGGCCDANGNCQSGTSDASCGAGGAKCQSCSASGKSCTQPGSYCSTVPPCSSQTCPNGCCDAQGICQLGRADAVCGAKGQACLDCTATGKACAPQGYCYAGKHCGADNCAGCCTTTGDCQAGTDAQACGEWGALCDDCGAKGQSCQSLVCSDGSTCPGSYAGCSPDALTPPPKTSSSCSAPALAGLATACAGTTATQACTNAFQMLYQDNPACYGCLLQFSGDDAYPRCLASFLTQSCNHALTCAVDCSNTACGGCSSSQDSQCRDDVFASGAACTPWVAGAYCAQAALEGPGKVCEYQNDVGKWFASVGAYFCQ